MGCWIYVIILYQSRVFGLLQVVNIENKPSISIGFFKASKVYLFDLKANKYF